jgi:hypothetical protein
MSLADKDKLDLVVSALQSIAAYPDARNIEELQGIVRQRLGALPVPRFVPEPVEIIHDPYSPKWPPPKMFDDPKGTGNLCIPTVCFPPIICTIKPPPICCDPPLLYGPSMFSSEAEGGSAIMLTGFTRDEYGRILCIQYAHSTITITGELTWT